MTGVFQQGLTFPKFETLEKVSGQGDWRRYSGDFLFPLVTRSRYPGENAFPLVTFPAYLGEMPAYLGEILSYLGENAKYRGEMLAYPGEFVKYFEDVLSVFFNQTFKVSKNLEGLVKHKQLSFHHQLPG